MSELTSCNRCTFNRIKAQNKGKKVTLKTDEYGWRAVYVNGVKVASFMKLTTKCAC